MTAQAMTDAPIRHNRPDPVRARATARAKYIRRFRRGLVFLATERTPVFAIGELIGALVARRLELGISTEELEYRAGLTENHAAKVESSQRVPGLDLFVLLVETMGGRVTIEWKKR